MRSRLFLAGSVLAVAAAVAGGASAASGPCSTGKLVKARPYLFALDLGPVETMYTPAEVKSEHPKAGEEMLSGATTTGMAAMTVSSAGRRQLEVHICTSAGKVYTKGHPTIVIADHATKTTMIVPVATMEGIGEARSDFHYGNNVELTAGHEITVTVTLDGRRAVFQTTVPKNGSG